MQTASSVLLHRMLLALLLLGMIGTLAELLLLEHTESRTQLVPLVALGCGIIVAIAAAVRTGPATLLAMRVVMLAVMVAGAVGVMLHYQGNVEFELERAPRLSGLELVNRALHGATPALAPGVLVQLGLLGLLYTWRHPRMNPQ